MSTKKEAWGIEVGAQAIKAMKLGRSGNGVALLDFDCMPFKQVLTTPDLNVEEAIRVNLEALATKHEFDKSTVVVSVPGNMAFARFAKLPPIESTKVKSIVAYEAQQQIPFPIDEVEWDYQVFAQEDAPDIEVGIFAITKERVANFLSNYRSVGLRVDLLTLSPVSVYNAFAHENAGGTGHGTGTVYLDIGTTSTDIIVVEDETIWLRTLPLGGNHFTEALIKQFKISFAKAEKLKLEAATSKYAKQIYQAMRGVFNDLVTEIERSLGFYTSLNRDAELTQIVGVGSTWKLPGLQKYIKQNTRMQVIRPDGFAQLEVEDRRAAEFSSVAVNMASAYGLALQGLGLGIVDVNVLPQSVLTQRMWKAKQPWFIAAAACVAGAAALGPITQFLESQSFNGAWNASRENIISTINEAQENKNTYDTVQTSDPRPGIRNYRRSFDYANLYTGLYTDVTTALATIEPHEALRDMDWDNPDAIKKASEVPRGERDQIWVTSISTEYQAPLAVVQDEAPDEDSGSFDSSEGGVPDSIGAGSSITGEPVVATLDPIPFPELSAPAVVQETPEGETPEVDPLEALANSPAPRIIVTVSGETTMKSSEISRVLNLKVVEWMRDNAIRGDRPYIILPTLKDPRFSPRPSTGLGGGTAFGQATQNGLSPVPTAEAEAEGAVPLGGGFTPPGGGFNVPGGAEGNASLEVKTPEGWYAKLGTSSSGFSIDSLYPRRPLTTEKREGDYNFTFKFEVILLSPDEARKTILPAETTAPTEQTPDSETTSPTAANQTQEDQA